MDFTSAIFWGTVLPALLLFWLANKILAKQDAWRQNAHKVLILSLSLTLLGITSWQTLLIFTIVLCLTWLLCKLGLRLGRVGKKILIAFSIPLILSPLLYYKYSHFLATQITGQEWDTLKNLIIPVGISFYSFQLVGFCIDTLLRQMPMPRFLDYLNFGAFFPQIVAGPIERRDQLLPQIEKLEITFNAQNINKGVRYIALGLFFKLSLADNLTPLPTYTGPSALIVWFFNIIFSLRIYFDFCGYGLIAWGIARCLGIKLIMNFWSPYSAGNITEFWRRWHISLTSWFRDYIYFKLGGSRTRFWALNILIVFSISGLWHGANWTFVIWGTLAGLAMVTHRLYSKAGFKMPKLLAYSLTMLTMAFIWMFFFTPELEQCLEKIKTISDPNNYSIKTFTDNIFLPWIRVNSTVNIGIILCSFAVIFVEFLSLKRHKDPYKILTSDIGYATCIILCIILSTAVNNQFIYFAF